MKILNLGSTNIDMTFTLDHIVQPGETISSYGMDRTASCSSAAATTR